VQEEEGEEGERRRRGRRKMAEVDEEGRCTGAALCGAAARLQLLFLSSSSRSKIDE
jgi:hypothetical protein